MPEVHCSLYRGLYLDLSLFALIFRCGIWDSVIQLQKLLFEYYLEAAEDRIAGDGITTVMTL